MRSLTFMNCLDVSLQMTPPFETRNTELADELLGGEGFGRLTRTRTVGGGTGGNRTSRLGG